MIEANSIDPSEQLTAAQRSHLAFEASYEISSLAVVLRQLIDDANLDHLSKACCGMLVRIEQLGEAISACVADACSQGRSSDGWRLAADDPQLRRITGSAHMRLRRRDNDTAAPRLITSSSSPGELARRPFRGASGGA